MNTLTKTAIALAFGLASVNSFAGSDSGIYVGGSVGQAGYEVSQENFEIDESSSAYKVFAGFNFGLVPTVDLAVELDYRDFGEFDAGSVKSELTSFDLYGIAGFKVGPVGFFGKAGYSRAEITRIDEIRADDSENSMTYGVGAKFGLGSIAFRAEYEMFDIDDTDTLYMASLGVAYTF